MRRILASLAAAGLMVGLIAGTAAAGGPPAVGFYVDGQLYRTVGTPTDLSGTGGPASSYDRIYALGGTLLNVAEAKPGDMHYNGGRWMVFPVIWNVAPVQLTSDSQVLAYAAEGKLTIATTPAKQFVCPVIRAR
jgi:hypothetical protein